MAATVRFPRSGILVQNGPSHGMCGTPCRPSVVVSTLTAPPIVFSAMYTPLMRAARFPDLFDIAQYLLAQGADTHLKCPHTGESAVSVAIAHSNVDLVRLLIEKYNVSLLGLVIPDLT